MNTGEKISRKLEHVFVLLGAQRDEQATKLLQQVFDNYKQDSQNPWGSDNTTYQALSSIKDWLEENIKKDIEANEK